MLDGLLGRGFAAKCKSLIKLTKSRIDVIRRKRNATQKFLKKDVADLLSNGLDINAYGRAEGLLAELNVTYCYDFVEQCCNFILKHLSIMQKQRDCPEDLREAVSSMMFATARFSDLPELRDLRHIFQERYGNSLEYFVNQELIEKSTVKPSIMEKKVQLMQDIASEFSIKWDARAFQQRMSKPSTSALDQPKCYGSFNISNDKYKSINGKDTIPNHDKDGLECTSYGHILDNGKEDYTSKRDKYILQSRPALSSDRLKPLNCREEGILKMDKRDFSLQGRQEVVGDKNVTSDVKGDAALKTVRVGSSAYAKKMEYNDDTTFKPHGGGRENALPKREKSKDSLPYGNPSIAPSYAGQHLTRNSDNGHAQHYNASSTRKIEEEEIPKLNPYYNNALPPPYVKSHVKSKDNKHGANLGSAHPGFDTNGVSNDSSLNVQGDTSERIQAGSDHRQHEKPVVGYTELYYKDADVGNPIPKPRSVRRRHGKAPSSHDGVVNIGDVGVVKRKSRGKRRYDSKRGLQLVVDDECYKNNEDERIIDKLLLHYSKKPSTFEEGMVRRKSKSRHAGESPQNLRIDGSDEMSEMVPPPSRSISLPHEQATSSETTKVFARAASFQPDRSNAARHVHPKLPDYDDLAARFAALKGR
ncbi:hypothetical protein Ddye_020903 [Dipteronia dyeriana]|uniref:IST1-like protein n=1 Tax=Dipteronia dyeriana TaxID=168575 RepID=A0AAD9U0K7_9ROSI|nr:hypothetical protein Ddye_020894 [Dipteronia dyeriana]KAK2645708.1 hypothetical protein Ddye_020903 [Dipteronia dyeriana]